MKRQSDKQKALLKSVDALRNSAIRYGVLCDGGCGQYAQHCHEITAGAHRQRALSEPRAQMWLCPECHDKIQGTPYKLQITLLTLRMIEAVNRCHGSQAVSTDDVVGALGGIVLKD